jgi:hypothetical protein
MISKSEPVTSGKLSSLANPAGQQDLTSPGTLARAGLPVLSPVNKEFAAPIAPGVASSSATAAGQTPIHLQHKYSWELGYTGGIGASTMNSSIITSSAVTASNPQPYGSPMAVTADPKKKPESRVLPDISYWAGIVARRPLSNTFTLSLGMDLHYYSVRQQVGEGVYNDPSSLNLSSSYIYNRQTQNSPSTNTYPYFAIGDSDVFVNKYYFLEMPVSILWKLNHSRNFPLIWENGLTLSYMVSNNSVYYNEKSGVFYKDPGNMTNKAQLNLSTSLLVGLPVKNIRIEVGPQLQYGLTNLQHQGSLGQHLLYAGFRIVLMPGKSKR